MPIYDDNPQNKLVNVLLEDQGNSNQEFTRNYVYDECGDFKSVNDIDIDGNPYVVVGPVRRPVSGGTTVLDVTAIQTITTLVDNGDGTATYTNEDGATVTLTLGNPNALVAADIDTFAELNAILTDATLVNTTQLQAVQDQLNTHEADTNNPHDTTLLNLNDVTSTTYTPGANYVLQANAAGTAVELVRVYEQTASREDPLLHQQTTFATYLVLTATIPEAGDYMLFASQRFSLNSTTVNFESHVEYNGDFYIINHVEFKDSAGVGQVVPNTTGGTTNTGTDNFQTRSGLKKFTLPAGTHVFTLEYRGQTQNQEATIYEAELYIKRIIE